MNAKIVVLILVAAIFLWPVACAACPMCADLKTAGPGGSSDRFANAVFWSILTMVSMPFVVTGVVAYRVAKSRRHDGRMKAGAVS